LPPEKEPAAGKLLRKLSGINFAAKSAEWYLIDYVIKQSCRPFDADGKV